MAERAYVRTAEARLDELIQRATGSLTQTFAETTTDKAGREVRDALANQGSVRLRALRAGAGPLCFGRIDHASGESLVVGRTGVADAEMEPLVVDWRAPAAGPFYKATGLEPLGVVRRRHFLCRHGEVVGLDDEVFDHDRADAAGLGLVGEAALLAALTETRGQRMGDIVATIQAEQHEIIHSPLPGVLIVQGGAGTGKTAVALHRAAYLLYAHRLSLEAAGVLFVGPNRRFLAYVGDVLPSLGETAVHMATAAELVDGVTVTACETAAVSTLKHDARMAGVIAAAVRDRERPLRRPLRFEYGAREVVLPASASARLVDATRASRVATHNGRARVLERLVLDALRHRYSRRGERLITAGARVRPVTDVETNGFVDAARRSRPVRLALARMWPVLTGEELIGDLLASPVLLAAAGAGILTAAELEALYEGGVQRGPDGRPAWSAADVALIDEASHLLGPATAGRARRVPPALTESAQFDIDQVLAEMPGLSPVIRDDIVNRLTAQAIAARVEPEEQVADRDRWRTYGHVLVDEAQDLSAMQWRMIARRSATGSFTVVGDLAQGTSPWSPTAWAAVAEQLGAEPKTVELSVGYRTPAEVMTLAASLLAASRPALSPPRPVRRSGHPPERVFVDKDSIIARSLDAAARHQHTTGGTVAVIAPASLLALLDRGVVDEAISVLDPIGAKGLEFDAVVLTEPVRIAAEHGGLAALYIAVTRTTDRLTIVHSQPLPAPLGTGTEYRVGGGRSVG